MRRLITVLLGISLCITVAGCGGGNANNILTLADTNPAKLDIAFALSLNVNETGKNFLSITTLQGKTWVAMSHGEVMTCNGIKLARDPDRIGFISSDFALATPTTPIICIYYSGGYQASFTMKPLPPPQITSPKTGAKLDFMNPLTVSYIADQGFQVRASPHVSNGTKTSGGDPRDKPDNGTITLDMHNLHPGNGFIQLTRFMDVHLANTGFHSFEGAMDTTTVLNVTWV